MTDTAAALVLDGAAAFGAGAAGLASVWLQLLRRAAACASWIALATASAQEVTRLSPKPAGLWQVMPISCFTAWRAWTPERQARETRRPIASHWLAAQPPALPMVVKSSKRPCVVLVDGDVEGAAAGLHLVGGALEGARPVALAPGLVALDRHCRLGRSFSFLPTESTCMSRRAVAVDRHPFAALLVGEAVDGGDVVAGGVVAEVDGLGDGVVGVLLEGRLHADVVFRGDVVGGDEDPADVLGDLVDILDRAVLGDLLHQLRGVEAALPGDLLEERIDLDEDVVVEHLADVADGEERLDAAGGSWR